MDKEDSFNFEEGHLIGFNGSLNLDGTGEEEKLFSNDTSAINIVSQGGRDDLDSQMNQ